MGKRTFGKRVLVEKSQGNRPLRRPRRRYEDNKINLQEVGRGHGLD
jgi:hypothetical protein